MNSWLERSITVLCLNFAFFPVVAFNSTVQAQEEKSSIAILPFDAHGSASPDQGRLLGDRIRSMVVQSQNYRVFERDAMDKILKEQGFQVSQNCENTECAIELGKLLSVKEILTGSLSQIGQVYSVQLRIINTETGTIVNEEFLDCECEFKEIMASKLQTMLSQLIHQTPASPQPVASPESVPPKAEFIRVQRPWLITANIGNINSIVLDGQYNFNPYFAVHGAAGMGFSQSKPTLAPESGFILEGGAKAYFNPHDLAGFADLSFSSNTFLNGLLGLEYRHPQGLTFSLATGLGFNVRTSRVGFVYPTNTSSILPSGLLLKASAGFAF